MGCQFSRDLFRRKRPEFLNRCGFQPRLCLPAGFQRFFHKPERMGRLRSGDGGAFPDGPSEKALRQRRRTKSRYTGGACGFPGQRHVSGIAAKGFYIILHPLKGEDLIEKAIIARRTVLRLPSQLFIGKETEDAQPVAHIDDDHAVFREALPAVILIPGLPGLQGSAVDIDQYRQFFLLAGSFVVNIRGYLKDMEEPVWN